MIQRVFHTYLHARLNEFPTDDAVNEFIYFMRTSEDMIPLPNTMDEAAAVLPNHVEVGYVNGQCLVSLEMIVTQVGDVRFASDFLILDLF